MQSNELKERHGTQSQANAEFGARPVRSVVPASLLSTIPPRAVRAHGSRPGLRLLLVHAHPDDESILNAATMARAVADGHRVTLLTATRGEAGEVYPAELGALANNPAALGAHREGELAAAMSALGVTDVRFLRPAAGPDRWVDSGMADARSGPVPGGDAAGRPAAFADADVLATAAAVARVIRDVRPHVLVTYDEVGGYGHPDHVAAHRAAMYGLVLAAAPGFDPVPGDPAGPVWEVPKVYWTAAPRSVVLDGLARAAVAVRAGSTDGFVAHPDPAGAPAIDDAVVTTAVDGTKWLDRKVAAMAAHRTQLAVRRTGEGYLFALTNRIAQPVEPVEHYRLVRKVGVRAPSGGEDDLFAGLDGWRGR